MTKLWLYITSWLKFQLVLLVIYIPLGMYLGNIGLIISGLLFLGTFSAAKDDMKKRYDKKQTKKIASMAKFEFEGFEQALTVTAREMNLI